LFEVFSVMLSTGFIGRVLISRVDNRLCPILAFWLGVNQIFTVFFNGFIPDLAFTPLDVTMVQTHLCLRYA
jgi:hypothetical protein